MIYTFYSYKGGVGRSMALVNVAELFYQSKLKVLIVDWDLEAPGLERFFPECAEKILNQEGVIDMLLEYKKRMSVSQKDSDVFPFPEIQGYLQEIHPLLSDNVGSLYLLSAGKRAGGELTNYANAVRSFDWQDFYTNWEAELFFEWLRDQLNQMADVVLIDSRTGVTEMGGVCIYQLTDAVVMLCGTNEQNLSGSYQMLHDFMRSEVTELRDSPLDVLVIPARIENAESDSLDDFKQKFTNLFEKYKPAKLANMTLWQLAVPYVPRYGYQEIIAVQEKNNPSAKSLVDAYVQITFAISRLAADNSIIRTNLHETEISIGEMSITGSIIGQNVYMVEGGQVLIGGVTTAIRTTSWSRQKLSQLDIDIDALAHNHFPTIYNKFVKGLVRDEKINLLLDHCQRDEIEMARLSSLLERSGQATSSLLEGSGQITKSHVPLDIPPYPDHFKNRKKELAKLLDDLQPGQVVTLCGPGGIGKTALASMAIWTLTDQGKTPPERFPDGIIFHSFYNQPQVDLAFEHIARIYGEEPRPTSKMAAQRVLMGRRVLLVLDGAEAADNLGAVLDIRGNCGVLVTSRDRADTFITSQNMSPLPLDDAADLLVSWLGDGADGDTIRQICDLVGRLPLAVRLVGRYLESTSFDPGGYLAWLEKSPLAALDQGKRREQSVPALLERSLSQVSQDAIDVMSVVGVLAMSWFDRGAVVAALEWNDVRCDRALGELGRFGLLVKDSGQFQVSHALVHTYSSGHLVVPDEGLVRVAGYYQGVVKNADIQTVVGRDQVEAVRPHVVRLIETLKDRGEWQGIDKLAWAIEDYLDLSGRSLEHVAVCRAGVDAAKALGNRRDEGTWLGNLGNTYRDLGKVERAIEHYQQALAIAREIGDRSGEGIWLGNLGNIYSALGQVERALEHYQQALAIAREIGDRSGEGNQLGNLGNAYRDLGQVERAIEHYQQALAIARETSYRRGEGNQLGNLGLAYSNLGQVERAIEYYQQALAISKEIGDRRGEGNRLGNLGNTYSDLGQVEQAIEHYQQALAIAREIGNRRSEGAWLGNLGIAYSYQNRPDLAHQYLQQALDTFIEIKSPTADLVRKWLDELPSP